MYVYVLVSERERERQSSGGTKTNKGNNKPVISGKQEQTFEGEGNETGKGAGIGSDIKAHTGTCLRA